MHRLLPAALAVLLGCADPAEPAETASDTGSPPDEETDTETVPRSCPQADIILRTELTEHAEHAEVQVSGVEQLRVVGALAKTGERVLYEYQRLDPAEEHALLVPLPHLIPGEDAFDGELVVEWTAPEHAGCPVVRAQHTLHPLPARFVDPAAPVGAATGTGGTFSGHFSLLTQQDPRRSEQFIFLISTSGRIYSAFSTAIMDIGGAVLVGHQDRREDGRVQISSRLHITNDGYDFSQNAVETRDAFSGENLGSVTLPEPLHHNIVAGDPHAKRPVLYSGVWRERGMGTPEGGTVGLISAITEDFWRQDTLRGNAPADIFPRKLPGAWGLIAYLNSVNYADGEILGTYLALDPNNGHALPDDNDSTIIICDETDGECDYYVNEGFEKLVYADPSRIHILPEVDLGSGAEPALIYPHSALAVTAEHDGETLDLLVVVDYRCRQPAEMPPDASYCGSSFPVTNVFVRDDDEVSSFFCYARPELENLQIWSYHHGYISAGSWEQGGRSLPLVGSLYNSDEQITWFAIDPAGDSNDERCQVLASLWPDRGHNAEPTWKGLNHSPVRGPLVETEGIRGESTLHIQTRYTP